MALAAAPALAQETVTPETYIRAEVDMSFAQFQLNAGSDVNRFYYIRKPTSLDAQAVVRMNRDTLYAGAVVDTEALLNALTGDALLGDTPHLAHAVLDVFEQEPLPNHNPLWTHPKVTVLPHISAPTSIESAATIAATNIRRFRETGEVPAAVDLGRGY